MGVKTLLKKGNCPSYANYRLHGLCEAKFKTQKPVPVPVQEPIQVQKIRSSSKTKVKTTFPPARWKEKNVLRRFPFSPPSTCTVEVETYFAVSFLVLKNKKTAFAAFPFSFSPTSKICVAIFNFEAMFSSLLLIDIHHYQNELMTFFPSLYPHNNEFVLLESRSCFR